MNVWKLNRFLYPLSKEIEHSSRLTWLWIFREKASVVSFAASKQKRHTIKESEIKCLGVISGFAQNFLTKTFLKLGIF